MRTNTLLKLAFLLTCFFVTLSNIAHAQRRGYQHRGEFNWGAGIRVGEPMGFNLRYYFPGAYIDAILGVPGILFFTDATPSADGADIKFAPDPNHMVSIGGGIRRPLIANYNHFWYIGVQGYFSRKYTYGDIDQDRIEEVERSSADLLNYFGVGPTIGIDYGIADTDILIFVEVSPSIEIYENGSYFYPMAGFGTRFYF